MPRGSKSGKKGRFGDPCTDPFGDTGIAKNGFFPVFSDFFKKIGGFGGFGDFRELKCAFSKATVR